jgi:preprotein translocase subunit SecD
VRRFVPLLILVIGAIALYVDFFPNAKFIQLSNPDAGFSAPMETKLGLDLRGGFQITYQAVYEPGHAPTSAQMQVVRTIMENRVNSTGAVEAIVETEASDRIRIEVPGAVNEQQLKDLVGQTGTLVFVPLPEAQYGTNTNPGEKVAAPGSVLDPSLPALFGGDQVDPSAVNYRYYEREWHVTFTLKDKGKQLFSDWSSNNVDHFFAIVLDGKVVSAPYIKDAITGGEADISGSFGKDEAKNLATVLQYGALPFPVQQVASDNIPATLGKQFLDQTVLAGAIGIGLVLLFMLIYYRLPGVVANLALFYYALVVYAIFRIVPVTLTLAGIAAFVLSVGMAVDANILIFERTKEELRSGKTLVAAVEAGFNRAWNSILDSNVSSLITATILYFGGSASIKGFALVLIIGVATSMFTAVTVSRTILRFVVRRQAAEKAWLYGVSDEEFQARALPGRYRREARGRA